MTPTPEPVGEDLTPVAANQRIEALDVVRGFALLGIFLMNIEFFNRPFATFNEGMPLGLTGVDWLATWFVNYFVQGKFWTIFSLLFGMGFAVLMVRAEQAGREFNRMYLRRVLALAVFGALHYILLWEGDILFSYAVAAFMLMVVLYGKPKPLMIGIVVMIGLGCIPEMDGFFAVAGGLAVCGLVALHLRSGKMVTIRDRAVPVFAFILLLIGIGMSLAATVFWALPDGPVEPRLPLTVFGLMLFVAGWLAWRHYEPVEERSVRLGVGLYMFMALAMTAGGVVQHFAPDPDAGVTAVSATAQAAKAEAKPEVKPEAKPETKADKPSDAKVATGKEKAGDEKKPKKTKAERAAERKAEREKRMAEYKTEKETELRVLTKGTYAEAVEWRARKFAEKAAGDFGFGIVFVGMFMLGIWFVRSGVMENVRAHLPFFRKLAIYGLTFGIGIGLLGSLIAMSHTPGDRHDGWGIARGLTTIGSLPACLGYVGLVMLMLHGNALTSRIRVLAPLGRMALTNYLLQSLIAAIYFYGHALGHWGMPRSQQVLFVIIVFTAQIAFSHWWLSRFRYGPMEWFWRGFTYRQVPKFRI
ncbi:MAG: DUF418 domain-containing protein [Betaproteobacteria bacterium]|nr:DUF418 domain-containing protein [Betaproteobacteria bacterium]